jgi:hypothetical protein
MAQYYLVEEHNLSALRWAQKAQRMGFLDFLRAIQNDPPALPRNESVRVDGVEDVLLASRPKMEEMARDIHRLLQRCAGKMLRQNTNIAIVVRTRLVPGDQLWIEHPTARIPLYLVFGSPAGGQPFYPVSFNLSSGF